MGSHNEIKLLLVDDEMKFLQVIAERLTLKGFDVIAASSGREALWEEKVNQVTGRNRISFYNSLRP